MSKWINDDGYYNIRINGRVMLEHRHIIEQKIGRELKEKERVHHINGDKLDNRPENLVILSNRRHTAYHNTGKLEPIWAFTTCLYCGKVIERRIKKMKERPHSFCNRECYRLGAHLAPGNNRKGIKKAKTSLGIKND